MTKIIAWNVNSVTSRLSHLILLIEKHNPDIILLQELKCITEKFPYDQLDHLGYNIQVFGQKSYNGVAILSKCRIEDVKLGMKSYQKNGDARYIECFVPVNNRGTVISSVYVPNGGELESEKFAYKLEFLEALKHHIQDMRKQGMEVIMGGDFNVAVEDIDVYNPGALDGKVCFHPEEKRRFRAILNNGMVDAFRAAHPDQQSFSWWDYRAGSWKQNKGMRIDYLLVSPGIADLINSVDIDSSFRNLERPSDHAPVLLSISS